MSDTFDYFDSTIDRLGQVSILDAPVLDAVVNERVAKSHTSIYGDIDEIINDTVRKRDDVSMLNRSISTGVQQNPDNFAKFVDLGTRAGIDPVTLQADPETLRRAQHYSDLNAIDIDKLYEENPKTAEFVSDPTNASVSHDDIKNLSEIEQDYKAMLDTLYTFTLKPVAKVGSGALIKGPASLFGLAAASIGKIAEDMLSEPKPYSEMAEEELIKLRREEGFGGAARTGSSRMMSVLGHALGLGPAFSKVEDYLLGQQRALNQYGDGLSGTTGEEGFIESSIMSGFESLGQMAPILFYGKMTGDWKGLLTVMSAQTLGTTYGEDRSKNISATIAQEHAFKDFVAEFATEMIPIKLLMADGIFKTNLLKNVANYAWTEGITEEVATVWQNFNKWSLTEPDKPVIEFLKEQPNAMLSTAIATTVAGIGQVGAIKVANSLLNRESTLNTKAYFDALANGVTNSKLQQRLPGKMKEFISKVKEQGDIKDVFINAERFATYFQENDMDPNTAANELLGKGGTKALNEAIAIGGDIVIPLETYAAQVAGTPYHEGLVDDLRLRQGDESARDTAAYKKREAETDINIEQLVAKARSDNVGNIQVQQIYSDLYNEALAAGVPPSQADTWAVLESDRYRTRGERLAGNIDPLELYNREGAIQISRPGVAIFPAGGEEKILNQFIGQKVTTTPEIKNAFTEAQKRLNTGEDPETVRQETGWFYGVDQQWRFEISDEHAKLTPLADKNIANPDNTKKFFLSEVLDHPRLFQAYPFLKTVEIAFGREGGALGYSAGNTIEVGKDNPNTLSTLLHETQHQIQRLENFAVGGSPDEMIGEKLTKERDVEMEDLKKELMVIHKDTVRDSVQKAADTLAVRRKMAKLFYENSYDAYFKLLGEQEARDVQSRHKMTAAERKAKPPVAMNATDAIIVFKNKSREMSVADIRGLIQEPPGAEPYALDKFASQFSSLIKQRDTKLEDVERIAKGVISDVKADPGKYLPVATADTLSYEQYLMMPDGTAYDPEKLEHSDATDRTISIYNAVKDGTIKKAMAAIAAELNDTRKDDLLNLANYLDDNIDYTIAEQAMILDGASKWGYKTEQTEGGIEVSLIPITANNRIAVPVIDGVTASLIAEQLRRGLSIKDAMLNGTNEAIKIGNISGNIGEIHTPLINGTFQQQAPRVNPFPESKVRNMAYHATTTDFEHFMITQEKEDNPWGDYTEDRAVQFLDELGAHFGSSAKQAEQVLFWKDTADGHNIIPVWLNFKTPFMMGSEATSLYSMFDMQEVADSPYTDWNEISIDERNDIAGSYTPKEAATKFKKMLIDRGYDSIIYTNELEGPGEPSYIAFNNDQIVSAITGQFMQQSVREPPLGFASFAPGIRKIVLNPKANLTTMIHELGHTWIEELQRDAMGENSTEQLKQDWDMLVKYTEMEDPDMSIPEEAHEKIARGIESYFTEGVAPSIGLRRVFHKVKAWMKSVYESLEFFNRYYGTNLNQDVRGVFDRMLALDAEIAQARMLNGYIQMFSDPEQAAMTEAEYKAYSAATTDTIREQEEKLIARVAIHLAKQQTAEWRNNREGVTKESEEHALTLKEYAAISTLSKGLVVVGNIEPVKLSKEGIIELIGKDGLKLLSPRSMKMKGTIYSAEGGVHPDTVAKDLGYRSGKAMLEDFTTHPPMKDYVRDLTDATMKERYGDPMDPGELRLAAEEEVHSKRQAELLQIELTSLKRKQAEVERINRPIRAEAKREESKGRALINAPIPMAVIKEVAYEEISKMKVGEIKPHSYLLAEVRAGNRAMELLAQERYGEAAEAQQQKILNYHLYGEAVRGKQEGNSRINRAYKLTGKAVQAKIGLAGQEWLEQINGILGDYSFATLPTTLRARRIVDFAKHIEETTEEIIAIAPSVIEEGNKKNYKELSLDELRAVTDTLESLRHIATKIYTVDVEGKNREINAIAEDLAAAAYANVQIRPMPLVGGGADFTAVQRLGIQSSDLINMLWRPEKMMEALDGAKEGIWHSIFWDPASNAQVKKDDLRQEILRPLVDIPEAQSKSLDKRMDEVIDIQTLEQTMTRRTAIGIVLNTGNASNRAKLQGGGIWFGNTHLGLPDEVLEEIINKLTEDDWMLVQGLWDTVKLLAPYLDDLNKRAVGLPLKMVTPTPIATKFGVKDGGYWPAVGDPRHTVVGERQEDQEGGSLGTTFPPKYPKAATRHSFREERTGAVYPLQFDWKRVLYTHVNGAITDIAYHEWIKQSRRILDKTVVKKALQNTVGEEVYRSLQDWLIAQVAPVQGGYKSAQGVDNLINAAISNVVVAALGFKATTVLGNMAVAPIQASHQIKGRYMVRGLVEYLNNPKKATVEVHAMSGEMRHRFEHYEQTFNSTINELAGNTSFRANVARMALAIHLYADRITSTFLWMAKYDQEMDTIADTVRAQKLADKMIRTTQTAGAPKDLSAFERDPRYKMFKMFLGPLIIMQNEQRGAIHGAGGLKGALTDPKAWGVMLATWIIPSMLFELVVGRGPDDDEEYWEWALRKTLLYQGQQMPFVRDAVSTLEGVISDRPAFSRSNPISDVLTNFIVQSDKAWDGDSNLKETTVAITRMIGPLTGFPSNAAVPIEEYLYDTAVEGFQPPYRLIYRRPKEQR